jgi:hypothetical protein
MDERISLSKTGVSTAHFGSIALHSVYDPIKEAERYIESLEIKNNVKHVILLEPALAYIIPVLRKKNPAAHIIVLRCSSFFAGKENPDAEWCWNKNQSLQSFLEKHIQDEDIPRIKIIEWRPSLDAYQEKYTSLLEEIRIFMQRGSANITTAKAFGLRWMRNCVKNLSALQKVLTFKPGTCPVLVCGAGPSLETAMPIMKQFQKEQNLFIIAVSSSYLALKERGINPGLIIGTDGGNWANFHFVECLRGSAKNAFICASLNAALPSQCADHPVLLLGDGSAWQSALLEKGFVPHVRFPQRGTVTAAALDVAFQLTSGKVFVSGIDLSQNDLLTHARPYAFDMMIHSKANRFHPYYSETFKRKEKENPEALKIYADWFQQYLEKYSERIFSLGKNHALFPVFNQHDISLLQTNNQLPQFSIISLKEKLCRMWGRN